LALGNLASADRPGIEHWVNLEAIQLLVHHASGVVAAIVIFALVARLAIWLLPHGLVRQIVVVIDDIVLIGLLVYFGYEMFVYLWNASSTVERKASVGAAVGAALQAGLPPSIAKPLGAIVRALARPGIAPW
jgi:uncharacterized protein YacL